MKTILVPTDLSRSADTALHLAITLAQAHKAKILLLHVMPFPVPSTPLPYASVPDELNVVRTESLRLLKTMSGRIRYAGGVDYEYFIADGSPVEQICAIARNRKADLIVMGISQKKRFQELIFGSTVLGVLNRTDRRVLVVPENTRISRPLKKITYAANYLSTDLNDLRSVVDLARPLQAQVNIMHISTEIHQPEVSVKEFDDFVQHAVRRLRYPRLSAEFLTGASAKLRLDDYLEKHETDLLVISARHRSLFARVFNRSFTLSVVQAKQVPVIVFHHPDFPKGPAVKKTRKRACLIK